MVVWNLEEAISYYKRQGAPGDQNALIALLREIQSENGGIPKYMLGQIAAMYQIKEGVLLVLILGLAVLIVMGYRWNVCRGCGSIGMALMVSGGIFLLLCGSAHLLAAAWSTMISYLIRMVLIVSLISAVVFFVLGAIGVAVDRITRKQV